MIPALLRNVQVAPLGSYKNEFELSAGVSKLPFATICPTAEAIAVSQIAATAVNPVARLIIFT